MASRIHRPARAGVEPHSGRLLTQVRAQWAVLNSCERLLNSPALLRLLVLTLALGVCLPAAAESLWITHVKLVSPEQLDRIEDGSVLVRDGRIERVVRGAGQPTPKGARRIDGQGYYLTPGLIDSHVHLHAVPGMSFEQAGELRAMADAYARQLPSSFLYFGYTTVVDLAVADTAVLDRFTRAPLHPDLVHCGQPLVLANGYPMSFVPSPQRFERFPNFIYDPAQASAIPAKYLPEDHTVARGVERIQKAGGICIKTHFERGFGRERNLPVISPALFAEVRAAATASSLVLVTHANSLKGQTFAVDGGADVLAHGMWHWGALDKETTLPEPVRAVLDRVVERGIGYQPTMQVLYGLGAYFDPTYLAHPAISKVAPPALLAWFRSPKGQWFKEELAEGEPDADAKAAMEPALRRQRQVVAYLAGKNARLVFGTDTPSSPTYGNLPGLNGYLEMQHWHEAGVSLAQIFKAATLDNARAFHLDARVGTIEAGKAANLLLMKQSPLDTVTAYDSVVTVWIGGRQVAREQLAADRRKN